MHTGTLGWFSAHSSTLDRLFWCFFMGLTPWATLNSTLEACFTAELRPVNAQRRAAELGECALYIRSDCRAIHKIMAAPSRSNGWRGIPNECEITQRRFPQERAWRLDLTLIVRLCLKSYMWTRCIAFKQFILTHIPILWTHISHTHKQAWNNKHERAIHSNKNRSDRAPYVWQEDSKTSDTVWISLTLMTVVISWYISLKDWILHCLVVMTQDRKTYEY